MRLSEASQGAAALAAGANVLIFPDADWDNLAYGLDEKWARAHFAGPIFQGLAGAANDASHGATADELVTLAAITAIQAASEALAASA
jgi:phosphate acetyltransferase